MRRNIVDAVLDNWPASYAQIQFWGREETVRRILANDSFQRQVSSIWLSLMPIVLKVIVGIVVDLWFESI